MAFVSPLQTLVRSTPPWIHFCNFSESQRNTCLSFASYRKHVNLKQNRPHFLAQPLRSGNSLSWTHRDVYCISEPQLGSENATTKTQKTQLDQLKEYTVVTADTGDFDLIEQYRPTDATTNPLLILNAASLPRYKPLVDDAVAFARGQGLSDSRSKCAEFMDKVSVNFGAEILKLVPGKVSTEVDARLSFDVEATVAKGRKLIKMYEEGGVDTSRVLIKVAATWEGIRAAEELEKDGITTNMTLIFSLVQAVACAEAGAFLISPFVGRILDWYKKSTGREYTNAEDPGVVGTSRIFNYYKKYGYPTIVMGASFRSAGEVMELAGCDSLTIDPKYLTQLHQLPYLDAFHPKLRPDGHIGLDDLDPVPVDEKSFRFLLNEDAMTTEKLAEGIRVFVNAARRLDDLFLASDG